MPDPDFYMLLEVLESGNVKYVVIGGIALLINGAPLSTSDIDLCIAYEKQNLKHLAEALNKFEPKLRNGTPLQLDEHAFGGEFVTYFTNVGIIQIINRFHGFENFQQLFDESPAMKIKELSVHVASLNALEKMKTGTGRNRDQIHLDIIKSLKKSRGP